MINRSRLLLILCLCVLMQATAVAEETLDVAVTGKSHAEISSVLVRFILTQSHEEAQTAFENHSAVRKRAQKAFAELAEMGVTLAGGAIAVQSEVPGQDPFGGRVFINGNGNGQQTMKKKVKVTETLSINVPAKKGEEQVALWKRVAEVIDTGKEVGLEAAGEVNPQMAYRIASGQQPAVAQFVSIGVADAEQLERAAYKAAVDEARRQAELLASLAGVKLGAVKSIQLGASAGPVVDALQPGKAVHSVSLSVSFVIGS